MKCEIKKHSKTGKGFAFGLNNNAHILDIVDYLGISHAEYVNYIKLYKAYPVVNLRKNSCSPIYVFKTQKQCQKFIESKELEPYLMMFKLTE